MLMVWPWRTVILLATCSAIALHALDALCKDGAMPPSPDRLLEQLCFASMPSTSVSEPDMLKVCGAWVTASAACARASKLTGARDHGCLYS